MPSNKFAQCVRQQVATALKQHYTDLGTWPSTQQLPIVYNEIYNVSFCGIENLHVFDSKKFRKVIAALEEKKLITKRQWRVVKPMKYMVAGTMLAAALAIERGWSMNIGGGMHHAYSGGGAGWCIFSDLTLALRKIRKASQGSVNKIMIIDTDVHQGNGYEKDKLTFEDNQLYILDIYNSELWPHDTSAKTAIDNMVELRCGTKDGQYLTSLESALQQASRDFQPDLILYNAGTDILEGDPLGRMSVSLEGVIQRDQMVFQHALSCKCPISMVLSGGYAAESHQAVAKSIENLLTVFSLTWHD